MGVTEGSEGNKITNEVFVHLCVCVCVWNRTMHVAFLRCQPRPLIGHRPGGHFIHCCVAERKKKKHSHTPENLTIFEKSRTYNRLFCHTPEVSARVNYDAHVSRWQATDLQMRNDRSLPSHLLQFSIKVTKKEKKIKSLLLHSCRTPVVHVLTSHQRRERGAGRNTIKDGGVFL